jgi:hypothetical protein
LHLHLRVDLPDGRYTLVPEGGDKGANEELQYMDVAQDLSKVQKGPMPTLPAKASLRSLTLSLSNYAIILAMVVHLCFRS